MCVKTGLLGVWTRVGLGDLVQLMGHGERHLLGTHFLHDTRALDMMCLPSPSYPKAGMHKQCQGSSWYLNPGLPNAGRILLPLSY